MRITSLIGRVSKELALSSNKLIKHQPALPQIQRPWQRAFCTGGIGESAGFRVKVTSREMIKPSSPTSNDKRTLQLSLIDQLATNYYIPMLLFYQNDPLNNKNIEKRSMLLKKSLAETLVDFYPLAGRIHQNELINCGDQGVEFSEAQAHLSENLVNFLEKPSIDELQALLPFKEVLILPGDTPRRQKNIVLSLQVNHFSCGGMAIGVCLHHKVGDGKACFDFLKAWAAKVREDDDQRNDVLMRVRPKFNGASLFPPVRELNEPIMASEDKSFSVVPNDGIAIRRVIFDKKAIDELKEQAIATYNTSDDVRSPSKVEAVTAFIFKHWPNKKVSSIVQVVNLRKRMVPPVADDFFGNCAWYARTSEHLEEKPIIQEFRKATEKISGKYMKEFISSDNFLLRLSEEVGALFARPDEFIMCNSLSGFSLDEINFGMGNPIWACLAAKPAKNVLFTLSTRCGQGIEAWVCLLEEDVATFEHSLSQLAYPVVMPINIDSSSNNNEEAWFARDRS